MAQLARRYGAHINLIPFNPGMGTRRHTAAGVGTRSKPSPPKSKPPVAGTATVRGQRGADIDAACGQLERKQEQMEVDFMTLRIFAMLLATIMLIGCGGPRTRYDMNSSYDFSSLTTWKFSETTWAAEQELDNLTKERYENATRAALVGIGLPESEDAAWTVRLIIEDRQHRRFRQLLADLWLRRWPRWSLWWLSG